MAYTELIKNFNRVRAYMRDFYVYGFKSREEYTQKSARSYDDERRRVESWLGEYMQFRQTAEGKNVFLSIDSRAVFHNPLFSAWKAKSFTDGEITLHFVLLDILQSAKAPLSLNEIMEQIDQTLSGFSLPRTFDVSTVRKKLKEYMQEGMIVGEKRGKTLYYQPSAFQQEAAEELLHFFCEVAPCGVIGSFLLDRSNCTKQYFSFKHHYITGTMDSEVLCVLFQAMRQKNSVSMKMAQQKKNAPEPFQIVPLKIMLSVQNGRQYVMAYNAKYKRITSYRLDHIESVQIDEPCPHFDALQAKLQCMLPHMWGVSTQGRSDSRMEHVEFVIRYGKEEGHIPKRLEREKRCGTVTHLDRYTSKFEADVYDASEMIPWIRTFLCRITEIHFSEPQLEEQFREDIRQMYRLYGLEDGEKDDIS